MIFVVLASKHTLYTYLCVCVCVHMLPEEKRHVGNKCFCHSVESQGVFMGKTQSCVFKCTMGAGTVTVDFVHARLSRLTAHQFLICLLLCLTRPNFNKHKHP